MASGKWLSRREDLFVRPVRDADRKLSLANFRADQRSDLDWLVARDEGFLVLGTSYGKTAITLAAIAKWREETPGLRTLVVSTKAIIELVWGEEIEKWDFSSGLSYCAGTGAKLERAAYMRPDVLGINFESLERFYNLVDEDPSLLPDILVIDESSKMKAWESNRVKRHCGFTGPTYVDRFKKRVALSATPCAEGYVGFWAQEQCVSTAARLGLNITTFRARYCYEQGIPGANAQAHRYFVSPENELRIEQDLGPDFLRISKRDDYLDLPPPIERCIEVPWDAEDRRQYDELEKKAVLDVTEFLDVNFAEAFGEDGVVEAAGKAVLWNKLRQLCSGFLYGQNGVAVRLPGAEAKLAALRRIYESAAGEPIVVFTQYIEEQQMIAAQFGLAQVGMPPTLKDWNAGRIPMLVLHPASAGHGLNLQFGSPTAVWFALPWSYEHWHQANGRLQRTGQTKQVNVLRFERERSIDQIVYEALQDKSLRLKSFLTRMRERQGQ
jgi:SNF2 family DNA or RNA helicase